MVYADTSSGYFKETRNNLYFSSTAIAHALLRIPSDIFTITALIIIKQLSSFCNPKVFTFVQLALNFVGVVSFCLQNRLTARSSNLNETANMTIHLSALIKDNSCNYAHKSVCFEDWVLRMFSPSFMFYKQTNKKKFWPVVTNFSTHPRIMNKITLTYSLHIQQNCVRKM